MRTILIAAATAALAVLAGCASYTWGTSVPADCRTIAVPVFENLTEVSEIGPIVTQHTLREFQRDGTFRIVRSADAAIEVQGVIRRMERGGVAFDRGRGMKAAEYRYEIVADITFVDKRTGKILLERKGVKGETTFLTQDDLLTGQRNAASRIAEDIARQVVNDALALPFRKNGSGAVEGVQK